MSKASYVPFPEQVNLSGIHTCGTCGQKHVKANGGRPITVCPFCGTKTPFQVPKR